MRYRAPIVLALTLLLAPAARAQPPEVARPAEESALAGELARLNATLIDIRALLEQITETQGLDLLMKRMELSSAQVMETEKRLRSAESERSSVEDQRASMEASLQSYLARVESGSTKAPTEQLEAFTDQYETRIERLDARMERLDDEIAMLGNLLSAKRRELEDWREHIDRRLGGV